MQKLRINSDHEEEKKNAFEMVTEGNDEELDDTLQNLLDHKSQTLDKMRNLKSMNRYLIKLKEQRQKIGELI